ncbi:MAG: phosphatidate cytidylyltransferase, partial [Fimbriimonas ginsengisoli]|nr:phosphatidate cytidylyltransferase [Fimbriimonas ginsengisoli]
MTRRAVTALCLIPVVLASFAYGEGRGLVVLAFLVTLASWKELPQVLDGHPLPFPILGLGVWLAWIFLGRQADPAWVASALIVLSAVGMFAAWRGGSPLLLELGTLWVFAPLLALVSAHWTLTRSGFALDQPALILVLPIWAGDTAAMLVGRAWGRHKLSERISPSKTIEGAAANFVACVAVAIGLAGLLHVPIAAAATIGVLAGTLGQAGDLFESALKRRS